jgi:aryl-alcohol dehydrogenase-like predicted oxidoreductase
MINRRDFLGVTAGAGAALALASPLLRAFQPSGGTIIQRAIPSTGEMLPVIGLGFANHPSCADPAALQQVLKTFFDNGGRVFDTMQASAAPEQFHATVANELGIQNELFLGLQGLPAGGGAPQPKEPDPAIARAQIESLLARFKVSRLDLVHLPVRADPKYWGVLKEAKKEGRIRYIGASGASFAPYAEFEAVMRNEPIDFISVDYSVEGRSVEQAILPLAQERKIGVMAHFPFGGAGGLSCTGDAGLFGRVGTTPLPEWAAEFDATTWAQFFLKYVISHPAVTVVRAGTTKVHHMLDNIGGGIGRLPDEATRKRMAELVDTWPWARRAAGFPPHVPQASAVPLSAAILDRYAGEYRTASGVTMRFRRDGATLLAKPAGNPEAPLVASSETRFSDPRGPIIEFQLDGVGKVTGLVLEQGHPLQKIPASRIR